MPAIRSDSLWRSSPAPRIVVVPAACAAARHRIGISSIAAATSAGPEVDRRAAPTTGRGGRRSARRRRRRTVGAASRRRRVSSMSAPIAPQQVDDRASRRVHADAAQRQVGVGVDGAGDEPERGRRHVAGDALVDRLHRPPSFETDRHRSLRPSASPAQSLRRTVDPARPQHPLRVVARRDRLADRRPARRPAAPPAGSPTSPGRSGPACPAIDRGAGWRPTTVSGGRESSPSGVERRAHRAKWVDDTGDRTAVATNRRRRGRSGTAGRRGSRRTAGGSSRSCRSRGRPPARASPSTPGETTR